MLIFATAVIIRPLILNIILANTQVSSGKNRTSVAILTGQESDEELSALADDVFLYFILGCRNVTKIYVPEGYNFETLLSVLVSTNIFQTYINTKQLWLQSGASYFEQ